MGLLDDQIEINENILKAVKDLMKGMEDNKKILDLLDQRIRMLEKRVDPRTDPRLSGEIIQG